MLTNSEASKRIWLRPTALATDGAGARGWYFYGIIRFAPLPTMLAEARDVSQVRGAPTAGLIDDAPLQLIECFGLAAVVRPVLLSDFNQDVLQERLRDARALETMVRSHHSVIEAIHAEQPILPAKFKRVFADAREIETLLLCAREALLQQLDLLEECDEWAVHVYADRPVVRERVSNADPWIRRLCLECAAAPSRSYFLERQLRGELEAAIQKALAALTHKTFSRLRDVAIAAEVNSVASGADPTKPEILRASFLVRRERAQQFMEEVRAAAESGEGLHAEYSGPWPPYSFTTRGEEARSNPVM